MSHHSVDCLVLLPHMELAKVLRMVECPKWPRSNRWCCLLAGSSAGLSARGLALLFGPFHTDAQASSQHGHLKGEGLLTYWAAEVFGGG